MVGKRLGAHDQAVKIRGLPGDDLSNNVNKDIILTAEEEVVEEDSSEEESSESSAPNEELMGINRESQGWREERRHVHPGEG